MTYPDIKALIAAMHATGVTRLDWEHLRKGHRLCLTLPDTPSLPPARPVATPLRPRVLSPAIGRFVARGGEDGLGPLPTGGAVQAGEPLGYIAQGAVLHVLAAPCAGWLSDGLPGEGQIFGHGDVVIELAGEAM